MNTRDESPLYLVIDQGGHATRAFVFDATGRCVSEGWTELATTRPGKGRVEHDARTLLEGTREAIAAAVAGLETTEELVAAGLATQRSTIVCWDRHSGAPLSPAISWQDTRNQSLVESLQAEAALARRISGLPLSAHYGASKLRWCLDNIPAVRKSLDAGRLAWGPLASYLLYGLLEEQPLIADPANAARTQLWDLHTRDWSSELLELFQLPLEPLPACVDTRRTHGYLQIAERLVPLRVCTGDQSAVAFAAGWPETGRVTVNVGTGAFIQRSTDATPVPAGGLLSSIIYSDSDRVAHVLEGTVNGAGAAIDTMAGQLHIDPAQAFADFDVDDKTVPLFLNGVGGLGAPFWRADFRSRFEGEGNPTQQLQAVVESVLFLIQANLDVLIKTSGPVAEIVLSGGLSKEPFFVQGLAALSGIRVLRPERSEATARGVAFLLSEDQARWPDAHRQTTVAQANAALAARYHRWQRLMAKALKKK